MIRAVLQDEASAVGFGDLPAECETDSGTVKTKPTDAAALSPVPALKFFPDTTTPSSALPDIASGATSQRALLTPVVEAPSGPTSSMVRETLIPMSDGQATIRLISGNTLGTVNLMLKQAIRRIR